MSEIASRVKAIIVDKLGVDENEVTETANFTQDLGADSLDTVELIMEFEKEFGINIPDDQAQTIATVGDAISYIEKAEEGKYLPTSSITLQPPSKGDYTHAAHLLPVDGVPLGRYRRPTDVPHSQ